MKNYMRVLGRAVAAMLATAGGCSAPPISASVTAPPTEIEAATQAAPADLPWWNDRVFYEIFVRSFYDSNADGIGDLRGIIQKLDYLNDGNPQTTSDLGVTGLWLMPVMASPSYHGYDVTDYQKIQPDYGSNDDFKELAKQAHERGIAVIIDLPLNHTSDQHPWFVQAQQEDSEYRDWYVWSDTDPGYVGPWQEPVWHPLNGRYYYGIFSPRMPDLNYRNPDVTTAMQEIARYWLAEMGVDGFRLDAARHLIEDGRTQASAPQTHEWLHDFNAYVKSVNPQALLVGEVWSSSREVATYIGQDQLDLAFEFDLASAILHSFEVGEASYLRAIQKDALDLYPAGQYAAFLTNHDQNRVMSELGGDEQKARAAAVLLLTTPGAPFIYYGEEIGMTGQKPDERIRTPLAWNAEPISAGFTSAEPWEALNPGFETANIDTESQDPESLLSAYRDLIAIRGSRAALRSGELWLVDSAAKALYACLRSSADETLLVLVNVSNEPVTSYALELAQGPLTGRSSATWVWGGGDLADPVVNATGGFDAYQPIAQVDALTAIIIQLAP